MEYKFNKFIEYRMGLFDIEKSKLPSKMKDFIIKCKINLLLLKVDKIISDYRSSSKSNLDTYDFYNDFFELYRYGYHDAKSNGFTDIPNNFQIASYPNCISIIAIDFSYYNYLTKYELDIYKRGGIEIKSNLVRGIAFTQYDSDRCEYVEYLIFKYIKAFIRKYLESYKTEWEYVECIEK